MIYENNLIQIVKQKLQTIFIYPSTHHTIMNIVSIQLKIKSLKLSNKPPLSNIFYSMRIGTTLSTLTQSKPTSPPYQQQAHLILSCDQSTIKNNYRACLVIYSDNQQPAFQQKEQQHNKSSVNRGEQSDKTILGMVYVPLKGRQNYFTKYLIQQCYDRQAQVELSFVINSLEVGKKQTSSQASRSSYAQIKEFHNVLSKSERKLSQKFQDEAPHTQTSNKYIVQGQLQHKPPAHRRNQTSLSNVDQIKKRNSNKTGSHGKKSNKRIRTEEFYGGSAESQSYEEEQNMSQQVSLQKQLSRALDKNMILTNLLIIEQNKFNEAQKFIQKVMQKKGLSVRSQNSTEMKIEFQSQFKNFGIIDTQTENRQSQAVNKSEKKRYQQEIDILIKERDQLYSISQQLFERTKMFKNENQKLEKANKSLQEQLYSLTAQVEDTFSQNQQLKQQLFSISDEYKSLAVGSRPDTTKEHGFVKELQSQLQDLNRKNRENERKLKESLKAIANFKNDALEARQQIILKEQEIQKLRKIMMKNVENSIDEKPMIEGESPQTLIRQMCKTILAINQNKQKYLNIISNSKSKEDETLRLQVGVQIINDMKNKIGRLYETEKKLDENIALQKRRNIMTFLNSYSFQSS